jgi:hypothetical protein
VITSVFIVITSRFAVNIEVITVIFAVFTPPCETASVDSVPDGAAESADAQPRLVGYRRHCHCI